MVRYFRFGELSGCPFGSSHWLVAWLAFPCKDLTNWSVFCSSGQTLKSSLPRYGSIVLVHMDLTRIIHQFVQFTANTVQLYTYNVHYVMHFLSCSQPAVSASASSTPMKHIGSLHNSYGVSPDGFSFSSDSSV